MIKYFHNLLLYNEIKYYFILHICSISSPFFTYILPSFHICKQPSHILNGYFLEFSYESYAILLLICYSISIILLIVFNLTLKTCQICSSNRRINYLANSRTSFSNYLLNGVIIFIFLLFSSIKLLICLGLFQPIKQSTTVIYQLYVYFIHFQSYLFCVH